MARINQLSFEVANLIAAGEVVERPASVVKELLENAIDAEAKNIIVEIRRGGVSLIRVTDDGVGMSSEDLPLAIRRHATSKIREASDLAAIGTLGFRGEALAATAAVSTLTIITKTRDAQEGTLLVSRAGEVSEITEVGCAKGTTVTVEELFANVPARRKFLKKDVTETAAVTAVVEKIAISRPDIAIRYVADETVRFATAGDGQLLHTLHALYGRELSSRLLPLSGSVGGITVSGYVGRPDNARANRNMQNFFINGRYVKSKTVGAALERAFTSYMAPERFPVGVIFLELPNFSVDVNVHPAKLEVKFENEKLVFEAVYYAVRSALEDSVARPSLSLDKAAKSGRDYALAHRFEEDPRAEQIKMPPPLRPERSVGVQTEAREPVTASVQPKPVTPSPSPAQIPQKPAASEFSPAQAAAKDTLEKASTLSPEESLAICEKYAEATRAAEQTETPSPAPKTEEAPLPEYRILGTAFRTYVLVELADERMLVIDQHAAHERILFEQLKEKRKGTTVLSVTLLLPVSFTASAEELAIAETEEESFASLGFTYSVADGKVHLLSIPADVTPPDAKDLFLSLCNDRQKGEDARLSEEMRREKMLYQMACKAAIKGGRVYDEAHISWLVEQMLSLPDITVCPHGRPIAFYLTKSELDRQFDRIK